MKIAKMALSVSAFALAAFSFSTPANAATDPAYNPSTALSVSGVVTAVRNVPAGQALEGVHLTVKTKAGLIEVYLGPKDFLKFLKTSFVAGDGIDVMGSRVKSGTSDVILAREVSDGSASTTLRDLYGVPVWQNWGVEADPASVQQ